MERVAARERDGRVGVREADNTFGRRRAHDERDDGAVCAVRVAFGVLVVEPRDRERAERHRGDARGREQNGDDGTGVEQVEQVEQVERAAKARRNDGKRDHHFFWNFLSFFGFSARARVPFFSRARAFS